VPFFFLFMPGIASMIEPNQLTISSALDHLRQGDFSSLDLTETCLRRVEELNPQLNAFITVTPETAVNAALAADSVYQSKPANLGSIALLGIPVVIKDLIDTAGVRTTAGSKFLVDNIPAEDAESVLRLRQAGAVVLGKTNTHEFAFGVTGLNPHFGNAKNPHNSLHVAGGSSSGSAVAVATGMCLGGLGTDTGGSIRIPASLCGVVGLKPSYGRISTRGVIPLSWNLDHVGILTKCVRDAGIMLAVLAGYDPHDPASVDLPGLDDLIDPDKDLKGKSIAMAAGTILEGCSGRILDGMEGISRILKRQGSKVKEVDMSWLAELARANSLMTHADAAVIHHKRMTTHPELFGQDVRQRLETGMQVTTNEYVQARRIQAEGKQRMMNFFGEYDFLVLPTTPICAPKIDDVDALEAARLLTRYTSPFNLTGLPAISVPGGKVDGLPFGIQIVTRYGGEKDLLRAAAIVEDAIRSGN
jgi:aspartyl-tRNA(Asn)/glutamyl-tRNA(Gln) amidotransferase subunit A